MSNSSAKTLKLSTTPATGSEPPEGGAVSRAPRRFLDMWKRDENRQLEQISQSIRLEEGGDPRLTRLTAIAISLSVLAFLVWAGVTEVKEIARTPGEIVPLGFEQTVQHLNGGVVRAIHIREGDIVTAGQPLVELESDSAHDLERAVRRQWALEVKAERLRAHVESREPDFSRFNEAAGEFAQEQRRIFQASVTARDEQANVIRSQIKQKRENVAMLRVQAGIVASKLAVAKDIYSRYAALHERGHVSYIRYAEAKQDVTSLTGEQALLAREVTQSRATIEEFQTRLTSLGASLQDANYEQLHEVEAEIAQNREIIGKLRGQIGRLNVRSPVPGVVKGVAVNTVGGVVQPGQTLMTILPMNERLVVEAKIKPSDIGHVRIGQSVQIKVSAYDHARYGVTSGRLEFVSATTFRGEGRDRYYRGRISFEQNETERRYRPILPGMTVMAEIVTGERSILAYLLKPIHSAVDSAFGER